MYVSLIVFFFFKFQVWTFCSVVIIILSVLSLMLETTHALRHPSFNDISARSNLTVGNGIFKHYIIKSKLPPWITSIDMFCTIVLSAEYVIRLLVSPDRRSFLLNPLNISDLLGLLPLWIYSMINFLIHKFNFKNSQVQTLLNVLSIFRLFRTLRFGRIMMLNKQLRILFLGLFHCWRELCILASVITVSSIIFGCLVYYIELPFDNFKDSFHGMWWAVITMTTIGYGDLYPISGGGYLVGVLCSMCGIILIALTTTVLVNNFLVTYTAVEAYERIKKSEREKSSIKDRPNSHQLESVCSEITQKQNGVIGAKKCKKKRRKKSANNLNSKNKISKVVPDELNLDRLSAIKASG